MIKLYFTQPMQYPWSTDFLFRIKLIFFISVLVINSFICFLMPSFFWFFIDDSSLPCAYDCHGHGACVMGRCVCNPDYAGDSCAYRKLIKYL